MNNGWLVVASVLGLLVTVLVARRTATGLRTLRARALTPVLSRRLAGWVKPRSYSEAEFFRADGAGEPWARRRHEGLDRLAGILQARHPRSRAWGAAVREGFSDLRFTDANRVPFPFQRLMRE